MTEVTNFRCAVLF